MPAALRPIDLADGRALEVRGIAPSDGDALDRFHSSLSLESTRLRFFSPHPRLSRREVERFVCVDHHGREALVATWNGDIIGVARYERLGESDEAEVAFVVDDGWRHRGVGTALLERLTIRAREEGIARFAADTLTENHTMLAVFAAAGHPLMLSMAHGVVHVTFPLE